MGSGRGDRNQQKMNTLLLGLVPLQWGPVVVTGIRLRGLDLLARAVQLQWGPVVVTGIRCAHGPPHPLASRGFNGVRSWSPESAPLKVLASAKVSLQWGPVVVTGISSTSSPTSTSWTSCFNGVRSW